MFVSFRSPDPSLKSVPDPEKNTGLVMLRVPMLDVGPRMGFMNSIWVD